MISLLRGIISRQSLPIYTSGKAVVAKPSDGQKPQKRPAVVQKQNSAPLNRYAWVLVSIKNTYRDLRRLPGGLIIAGFLGLLLSIPCAVVLAYSFLLDCFLPSSCAEVKPGTLQMVDPPPQRALTPLSAPSSPVSIGASLPSRFGIVLNPLDANTVKASRRLEAQSLRPIGNVISRDWQILTLLENKLALSLLGLADKTIAPEGAKVFMTPKMSLYLRQHAEHLSVDRVAQLIAKGKEIIETLYAYVCLDPKQDVVSDILYIAASLDGPSAQEQLKAIAWYLMFVSVEKDQGFVEGAWILEDKERRLGHYLRKFGYNRISSHLRQVSGETFGIDLTDGSAESDLPAGHRHMLCRFIDNHPHSSKAGDGTDLNLFIKLESHGTMKYVDFYMHALSYFYSIGRKNFPAIFGSDQQNDMRKEHTPKGHIDLFLKVIKNFPGVEDPQILLTIEQNIAAKGWGYMYRFFLENVKQDQRIASVEDEKAMQEDICTLWNRLKQVDHPEMRFGTEVILLHDDLRNGSRVAEDERYNICEAIVSKKPFRFIANKLNRNPLSISRKIKKNKGLKGYRPKQAQRFTEVFF